jgi:APA family basic amino acid/polyamine antiporter
MNDIAQSQATTPESGADILSAEGTEKPKRGLNLLDSSMLIMGSMIGSGIFIVSADIARNVDSPLILLLNWLIAGIITVIAALSYGELAAAMPKAGGQYVYLREAYNKLMGFLYGWTLFTVIQTGTIAAVAVGFAKFTGVFVESISATHILFSVAGLDVSSQQVLGIACILILTFFNFRGIRSGAIMQNIFTISKIVALLTLVIIGLAFGLGDKGNFEHFKAPAVAVSAVSSGGINIGAISLFIVAMVGSLFSMDAWNNITFTAGEVINPKKNLPRSLLIGTGTVILIYLLANVAYILVLPFDKIRTAPDDRVATLMMETVMGKGGKYFMAALVMVSTFGCLNGLILSGARVYYAMAKDRLFFRQAGKLNKNLVPANSLVIQAIWACGLTLSGSYSELLDYVIFAVLLFYIFTIGGLFILRYKQLELERPYKVAGYPILPALYIVAALIICVFLLIDPHKGIFARNGFFIVLAGIPVYFLTKLMPSRKGESI